jgi:putative addiction module component (TIGR02574 family)
LSPAEKLAYVRRLWAEVLATPDDVELTEAQRRELQRRLEAHRKDPSAARPWAEVRAELRAKFGPHEDD